MELALETSTNVDSLSKILTLSFDMKEHMKNKLDPILEATGQYRTRLVMDKMTSSKRIGKIHALICLVPENFCRSMDSPGGQEEVWCVTV